MRDPHSVTCSATIEAAARHDTDPEPSRSPNASFARPGHHIIKPEPCAARTLNLGLDGTAWIRSLGDERFLGAVQVVDIFHAGSVMTVSQW